MKKYNIAYGCFLFSGIVSLLLSSINFMNMDTGTAGGLGFLVVLPLSLASVLTILIGIGFTIRLFHHWQLVVLSLLSLLFLAEITTEFGSAAFYNLVPMFYGLITILFSLVWFFVFRKQEKN